MVILLAHLVNSSSFIYLEINSPEQTTTKNVVLYYLPL
ncbi:hypothetical protein SF123566_8316 [Shigella flexneri 1235-66]|nr:hypothetical protein SF123566_8316 [Shigella flexneri 1235-66]